MLGPRHQMQIALTMISICRCLMCAMSQVGRISFILYDEHVGGKDGHAVCSMRWVYHTTILKEHLRCNKDHLKWH